MSGRLVKVGGLVALEFGLAVIADFSGRLSSLVDSLLAETYSNFASIRLMEKATSLDLEHFESEPLRISSNLLKHLDWRPPISRFSKARRRTIVLTYPCGNRAMQGNSWNQGRRDSGSFCRHFATACGYGSNRPLELVLCGERGKECHADRWPVSHSRAPFS